MKVLTVATLFILAPTKILSLGCNEDNALRALRANSAKASPFCSTYTLPPPNQPLPTYVSTYPASRISSACSCLVTPSSTRSTISTTSSSTSSSTTPSTRSTTFITSSSKSSITTPSTRSMTSTTSSSTSSITTPSTRSTTSTTSSSTSSTTIPSTRSTTSTTLSSKSSTTTPSTTSIPPPDYCETEVLKNGDFHYSDETAYPWEAAPRFSEINGQSTSSTFGEGYAGFSVNNYETGRYASTYIKQTIPPLCHGVEYNLTYTSRMNIRGELPGESCSASYSLDSIGQLVYIGQGGDYPPYLLGPRHYVFTYPEKRDVPDVLTIEFFCSGASGTYGIAKIGLVGHGHG